MVDFTKLKEILSENKTFIAIFLCVVVIAAGGIYLIPQDGPDPPEERPFVSGLSYEYTTVNFDYAYTGPEEPEEDDIVPERVIIHTTENITEETRIHEFNPTYKGERQLHEINLKEIADNPDDHLRTHPKINMTVVYTNGARETVTSTVEPENIVDIISTSYQITQSGNGSVLITFNEIDAEQIEVKAPNNTYTVSEDGSQVEITPEDYYQDKNEDGLYESRGEVKINKQYKDISETIRTLETSFQETSAYTSESNRDGHFTITISDLASYDSVTIRTPGGEYIKNYNPETREYETGSNAYLQTVSGIRYDSYTTLTIKEDAEAVEIYAEIDGQKYLVQKLGEDN